MTVAPASAGRRVFEGRRIWRLDDHAFNAAADLISRHEAMERATPALVVGIARGGRPLAARLGQLLEVPIVTVTAQHNTAEGVEVPATGRVTVRADPGSFERAPRDAQLLVVDDICGTGATLAAVGDLVSRRLQPRSLRTATLCRNTGAPMAPDVWVWDVSDWVVFPWEPPPPDRRLEPLVVPPDVRSGWPGR